MTVDRGDSDRLVAAREIAEEACRLARSSRGGEVFVKDDGSAATETDLAVEDLVRSRLALLFPGDAVVGEERGGEVEDDCWVVDPIDDTDSFLSGIPIWAVLISWRRAGRTRLALATSPIGTWEADEVGCRRAGIPVGVSETESVSGSAIALGGVGELDPLSGRVCLERLGLRRPPCSSWLGQALVASGRVDAMVASSLRIWDFDAPAHLVRAAGGRVTGLDGADPVDGGPLVATNGRIHEELLAWLNG